MQGEDFAAASRRRWQVSIGGRIEGPYDLAALERLAAAGRLTRYALVRPEGENGWRLLSSAAELSAVAAALPGSNAPAPAMPVLRLRRAPRSTIAAFALVILLVAGYWGWHLGWIGPDLWPWYRPSAGQRRIANGRWISPPAAPGVYALDRGKLVRLGERSIAGKYDFSPEVEFLLADLPPASRDNLSFCQLGPEKAVGRFKDVSNLGYLALPLRKRQAALRVVPPQPLAPGFYRLGFIGSFSVEYGAYCNELRTQTEAALKEARWGDVVKTGRMCLSLAGGLTTATEPLRREWTSQIVQALDRDGKLSPTLVISGIEAIHEWYPANGAALADHLRKRIPAAVAKPAISAEEVENLVGLATIADSATSLTTRGVAWKRFAERLVGPHAIDREPFLRLFKDFADFELPDGKKEGPLWLLAQSFYLFEQSHRQEAVKIWEKLASDSSNASATQAARQLLAPPPEGARDVKREPIIFKQNGREAMRVELASFEVRRDGIQLGLRARNADGKPRSLLYAEPGSNSVFDYKGLYLSDDVEPDKRFVSPQGYLGGGERGVDDQSNLRGVQLPPGQTVAVSVRFPPVSPGATRVAFTSPACRGQSEWRWADLPLKAGPFEPPLRVLPLEPGDAENREIAPAAASAAPTPAAAQEAGAARAAGKTPRESISPGVEPTPVPAKQTPAPAKATAPQKQAATARQQAQKAQEQSRSRLSSGNRALKHSLFDSAEQQRQAAEEAYQAGDYAKAEVYFKQAIDIFKQVPR